MFKKYLITYLDENDKIVYIEVIAKSKEEAVKYIQNLAYRSIISINQINTQEITV